MYSEQCEFFMWVEDNPLLVAAEIDPEGETEQDWKARMLEDWRQK